jgi:CheY-like chemotaxis protein
MRTVHHALVLNLHQPAGTLESLLEHNERQAREIPFSLDRIPRSLWSYQDVARVKVAGELQKIPVIVLTTADGPREVKRCHELGCKAYIQKSVDCDRFADTTQRLGTFLALLLVPTVNGQS